jgi:hypothetical protein
MFVLKKREGKASKKTRKKLLICLRTCEKAASVRSRKLEAERASQNQECQENKVQRSRRENKGHMQPQKNRSASSPQLPTPPATQLQQTSPMLRA